ncbi:hypothetical protein C0581_03765 [Candidatus Parcubacteria bacterium]|nr:MAG: hypothetical protein C0581_03765 [Candidatus Parcubacteria bacterium]
MWKALRDAIWRMQFSPMYHRLDQTYDRFEIATKISLLTAVAVFHLLADQSLSRTTTWIMALGACFWVGMLISLTFSHALREWFVKRGRIDGYDTRTRVWPYWVWEIMYWVPISVVSISDLIAYYF